MKKTVLLTRPRAASEKWAALLSQHGYDVAIEPLLTIEATGAPRPDGAFQAVLFTSSNAPDALKEVRASVDDLLALPCFCVGLSTGAAARALGFTDIRSGTSDSTALAEMTQESLADTTRPLLHIGGEAVDGKAHEVLSRHGFTLALWSVYRARPSTDLRDETRTHFAKGDYTAVPVFSPRTARTLVALLEKNRLTSACSSMTAIALSRPVGDVLQTLPWRQLLIAATPSEEAVLACLEASELSVEKKSDPAPSLAAFKPARRSRAPYLILLLLAVIGSLVYGKLEERRTSSADTASVIAPVVAPPTETNSPAPPQAPSVDASIPEPSTVASSGTLALQRRIAASFAFWDVRSLAEAGKQFDVPLRALKQANDDETVAALLTRLEPYESKPPLTYPQLRAALDGSASHLIFASDIDAVPSWQARVEKALRPLIRVHKAHPVELGALDEALDREDGPAIQDTWDALPESIHTALSDWQKMLASRQSLDNILHDLTQAFETASENEGTP